jgi:hypothetical protein
MHHDPTPCPRVRFARFARLPLDRCSRSDFAIIVRKFESGFNCLDESCVNVSTLIDCEHLSLTAQTRAVAGFYKRGEAALTVTVRTPITNAITARGGSALALTATINLRALRRIG